MNRQFNHICMSKVDSNMYALAFILDRLMHLAMLYSHHTSDGRHYRANLDPNTGAPIPYS